MSTPTGNLQADADRIARANGINPGIYRALVGQESAWKTNARSPAGARGLTQLMPGTAAGLGVTNPDDPIQSLQGGAKYLKQQLDRFGGNYSKALAAYNAGPGAVEKYGGIPPYAETQNYVKTILGNAKTTGGAATAPSSSPTTTTTTPGVDNSGLRQQLVGQFLQAGGVRSAAATAAFASGIRGAQDTAPSSSTTSTAPSSKSSAKGFDPTNVTGVKAIESRAEKLDSQHRPYLYGGGHAGPSWSLDCSAAVSQALGVDVRVSGEFEKFGQAGTGKSVSIYASPKHVLMRVKDPSTGEWHWWGTSNSNPQGGAGWIKDDVITPAYLKQGGFVVRHPVGM